VADARGRGFSGVAFGLAGLMAAATAVMGGAGAVPAAGAQTTAPPVVTGVVKVQSPIQEINSQYLKQAQAVCPVGKKVVGGGGWAFEVTTTSPERLALVRLEPTDDVDGNGGDGFIVGAAEVSPGVAGDWWVQAYALCADAASVPGWHISTVYGVSNSDTVQTKTALCNNQLTQRVIGAGARVRPPLGYDGEVVLQVAQPFDNGRGAMAQAHEDSNGYLGDHWLGVFAICMDTPAGYEVKTVRSTAIGSETVKTASVRCGGLKRNLSAGSTLPAGSPGELALQRVFPASTATNGTDVTGVETAPTSVTWDVTARAICVTR
jgi:hypothetical protein